MGHSSDYNGPQFWLQWATVLTTMGHSADYNGPQCWLQWATVLTTMGHSSDYNGPQFWLQWATVLTTMGHSADYNGTQQSEVWIISHCLGLGTMVCTACLTMFYEFETWLYCFVGFLVSWGRLNIKMSSYQYMDPHVKDKTVSRPSYL